MKRSGFIQRTQTLSQRAKLKKMRVTNPLKRNALGESAKGYKEPVRNQAHMAKVAALGCWICGSPAQVHHVDCCTPKGAGPKVSDFITAPLCPSHHTGEGQAGHKDCAHIGEREFWPRHGIDIGKKITSLLVRWYYGSNPDAQAAIDAIEAQRKRTAA